MKKSGLKVLLQTLTSWLSLHPSGHVAEVMLGDGGTTGRILVHAFLHFGWSKTDAKVISRELKHLQNKGRVLIPKRKALLEMLIRKASKKLAGK